MSESWGKQDQRSTRRLLAGFLVTGTVTLLAGTIADLRIDARMEALGEFHDPNLRAILNLTMGLGEGVEESFAYVVSGDLVEKEEFLEWARSFDVQSKEFAKIAQLHLSEESVEREIFEQIVESQHAVVANALHMFEEYENRGSVDAQTFDFYETSVDRTLEQLNALIEVERSEVRAAQALARDILTQSKQLLLGVGALALVLATGLGIFLSRHLTRQFALRREAEATQRELEEQLRQSQKMEVVGQLAGGVAHDFNNNLTVIFGGAEALREELPTGSAGLEYLAEIEVAAKRSAGLTQQLLAFSRRQVLERRVTDLNSLVSRVCSMLRRTLGDRVELHIIAAADLSRVLVDPGQIEQVLMNLALNARDAMPESGGSLTFETRNLDEPSDGEGEANERHVMLIATDTGVGIDEKDRDRIFEPFFTTKAETQGSGLGLSTVYGIISQHGGTISASDGEGCGTRFEITLPRVDAEVDECAEAHRASPRHDSAVVLLVEEDDPMLRRMVQRALESWGYQVLSAEDGIEAINLSEKYPGTIDLLLSDVMMPKLGGLELATRIREKRAKIRVLFISGFAEHMIGGNSDLAQGQLLEKPFTLRELSHRVQRALDSDLA